MDTIRHFEIGDAVGPLVKPAVTKTQLVMYSGASGDFNPIHTVEEFAQEVGLGGVIAHGMLTMAFVGQMLEKWIGFDGELRSWGVRFFHMVRPGDIISCYGKITNLQVEEGVSKVDLDIWAENQSGDHVVEGTAKAWF